MKWTDYISFLRERETEIVFNDYPPKYFQNTLELGAGNGFQSVLIKKYTINLISTDIDENRLKYRGIVNGIEYLICDAENVDNYFKEKSFDLVFASNLFEHLPNPEKALKGIRGVLKSDGIVILVLPSSFWAIQRILLHYPYIVYRKFFLKNDGGKKKRLNLDQVKEVGISQVNRGNNLKSPDYNRNRFFNMMRWPQPHGISNNNFREILNFRKKYWLGVFSKTEYEVINIKKGPVMSGRGLGLNNVRSFLQKLGFTGEYIYFIKPKDK